MDSYDIKQALREGKEVCCQSDKNPVIESVMSPTGLICKLNGVKEVKLTYRDLRLCFLNED